MESLYVSRMWLQLCLECLSVSSFLTRCFQVIQYTSNTNVEIPTLSIELCYWIICFIIRFENLFTVYRQVFNMAHNRMSLTTRRTCELQSSKQDEVTWLQLHRNGCGGNKPIFQLYPRLYTEDITYSAHHHLFDDDKQHYSATTIADIDATCELLVGCIF